MARRSLKFWPTRKNERFLLAVSAFAAFFVKFLCFSFRRGRASAYLTSQHDFMRFVARCVYKQFLFKLMFFVKFQLLVLLASMVSSVVTSDHSWVGTCLFSLAWSWIQWAASLWVLLFSHILLQNVSTSTSEGGFWIVMAFFPSSL